MLGIIVLSTISTLVVTVVFVSLLWAAVSDGREQARVDASRVALAPSPVRVIAPSPSGASTSSPAWAVV